MYGRAVTTPSPGSDGRLISAAEVARLAGVTRAAVSNWRRRHSDFPEPVGGGRNALFALSEITGWLDRQRKNTDVSDEVLVWQELRARFGEDMTGAVAEVAALLAGSGGDLDEPVRLRLLAMAGETSPEAVVTAFTDRLIASGTAMTTAHLARAVVHFAGPITGTVFDPAAGAGTLLLACAESGKSGEGAESGEGGKNGEGAEKGTAGGGQKNQGSEKGEEGEGGAGEGGVGEGGAGEGGAGEGAEDDGGGEGADSEDGKGGSGKGRGLKLAGQDGNPAAAALAAARAKLSGATLEMRIGDSFQRDAWPSLRADLVVCDPPVGLTDWGRDTLMLDRRWEFGIPTKAESELAWLQHCYAHTAPGGRVVFVMPPSVAYRRAGKRIRAELLRAGIVEQIVALPPGMVASHAQPVHLWVLRRLAGKERPPATVRMTDLSAADPEGPFTPDPAQVADIPVIDLLDEDVDLTPAAHTRAERADLAEEYAQVRSRIQELTRAIAELFPELPAGTGSIDGGTLRIADLARAGLVDVNRLTSASDQLDTDYLRGFLRAPANSSRNTSSSGTYRFDPRGSRVPQMDIEEQRRYGAVFRALDEAERSLRELSETGLAIITRARDGLTSGTLRP